MSQSLSRRTFVAAGAGAFASIGIIVPARAADFSYKYGHDLAVDHPLNTEAIAAFGRIAKATNGRLEFKAFPNSQLGGDPAMITQLRSGALELMACPGAFLNSFVPVAAIENVAFAFKDRQMVFRAMDGSLGAIIRDDIDSKSLHAMDKIWENGYRDITTSNKPIRNVADLQGEKIRVSPGKIRIDTFQSLGASPTPIAVAELYTALQTHIVDAQENPLLNIETQKFYEVQKYVSTSHHMWTGYWLIFNGDAWNKLPKNMQSIVAGELNNAAVKQRKQVDVIASSLRDKLARRGMAFNNVDVKSFKDKLVANGYYKRWQAEFGDKAWNALETYTGKFA